MQHMNYCPFAHVPLIGEIMHLHDAVLENKLLPCVYLKSSALTLWSQPLITKAFTMVFGLICIYFTGAARRRSIIMILMLIIL